MNKKAPPLCFPYLTSLPRPSAVFFVPILHYRAMPLQDQSYLLADTQDHPELHPAVVFRVREAYLFELYCVSLSFTVLR